MADATVVEDVRIVDATNTTQVAAVDSSGRLSVSLTASSATVTVDTELPAAASLADATANPSVPGVGAFALLFNGTTWDRMRGDITNGLDVDVTRVSGNVSVIGEVASGSTDAGNPQKIGGQARSTLPTAVTSGQRVNGTFDLFGRQLVGHIDPAMQVRKAGSWSTTQTGTVIWTPASGKKVALTHLNVTTGGTTAGIVTLFFNSTTTFTEGTHDSPFRGEFAPGTSSKPGAILEFATPFFAGTADHSLRITTSAGITVYVQATGYEF